ncbi:MAG: hypothetical protein D6689_22325 [Deltaproteobacteria bacterium]|nr:MAG: hypothetical protein D6689_22325 [Deltaproteobacteria bacterium]
MAEAEGDSPRADAARLLAPDFPGRDRYDVTLLAAGRRGRVAAIVNPHLRDDTGRPIGLLGAYACVDDDAVAAELLAAGCAHLRARGCARVCGPIALSTWHLCRFTTAGDDAGWVPGDPDNPPRAPRQWQAAGFERIARYCSNWLPDPESIAARFAPRARDAERNGYRVRRLRAADAGSLYEVALAAFSRAFLFAPIDRDEFDALYPPEWIAAGEATSPVAIGPAGDIAGFFFTFPATVAGRRTLVGKTLAVAPAHRGRGVYELIMHAWLRIGLAAGYDHFAGWLMHADGPPARMGWARPETCIKEYALYGRSV